jgi:hypothetical protein
MMTTLNTMKWHKTPKKGSKGRMINRGKDNLTEKDRRTEDGKEQKDWKSERSKRNGRSAGRGIGKPEEREKREKLGECEEGEAREMAGGKQKNFAGWEKSVNLATYKLNQWPWPCV